MPTTERRNYVGGAIATTLATSISAAATTLTIAAATGWASGSVGPFTIVLDPGTSSEEKIKIASRSGNTLTVASGGRGVDGTTAVSHDSGAVVKHVLGAYDIEQINRHAADPTIDDHTQYVHIDTARTISADHTFSGEPVFSSDPVFNGDPVFTGTPQFSNMGSDSDITTVGTGPKSAGTSDEMARADHEHDVDVTVIRDKSWKVGDVRTTLDAGSVETGWLELNGQTFDGGTYPALAALLGSTTLPDFRDRVPYHVTNVSEIGDPSGANSVTLTTGQLPSHAHTINHGHGVTDPGHRHSIAGDDGFRIGVSAASSYGFTSSGIAQHMSLTAMDVDTTGLTVNNYAGNSGSVGSGDAINTTPKRVGLRYLVKAAA